MQQFEISGMACSACSAKVEKAVSSVKGVSSCSVNLITGTMVVDGNADSSVIIETVDELGFGCVLKSGEQQIKAININQKKKTVKVSVKKLLFSFVLLSILMYFSMGGMLNLPTLTNESVSGSIQGVIALVIILLNRNYYISGIKGIRNHAMNMDTLISMGSFISFAYSVYLLFSGTNTGLYFDSSAMILVMVSIGKFLESKAKIKASNSTFGIEQLIPETASVIKNGFETVIPVSEIQIGDTVIVRMGESFPVDGIVINGKAFCDESFLTGESNPIEKQIGSTVSAGSICVSGYCEFKVTEVGKETFISKIINLVEQTGATKAPIAKTADKVAGVFVPVVMMISLFTFLIRWLISKDMAFAVTGAVSVLVISCPCSLGLATPVAITVGSGIAAKRGILFKSASALEEAGRTETVIIDKTGTITTGVHTVTDIFTFNGYTTSEVLESIYAVENKSDHPIAKSIVSYCKEQSLILNEISDFSENPGKGVSGLLPSGNRITCGNPESIKDSVQKCFDADEKYHQLAMEGKTPIIVAINNLIAGVIAVSDSPKSDSKDAIKHFKSMKIKTIMLTGDNKCTAEYIGKAVDIDEIVSEVLPDNKFDIVRTSTQKVHTAMIGDGINDSPALIAANLGMAMGNGTDIAIDSADVILVNSTVSQAADAIFIGKSVLKNIKQNLFLAFFYNILCIPLAAGLFIPIFGIELNPMICSIAMSFSSLFVVLNALRLEITCKKQAIKY